MHTWSYRGKTHIQYTYTRYIIPSITHDILLWETQDDTLSTFNVYYICCIVWEDITMK